LDKIKDIIPQVIESISQTRPGLQAQIIRVWEEIARGKTAQHTAITGLQKGRLVINVDSPVWLFQMNMQKRKVLEQFKKKIPELSDITFRIGKV